MAHDPRPFNPSNQAGSCLYCGKKLSAHVGKEITHKNTVTLCCQAPIHHNGAYRWSGGPEYSCSRCRRVIQMDGDDTEVQERTVVYGQRDYLGYDGLFCTANCGYRFGVLAAKKGVRYTKRQPQGEVR